LPAHRNPFRSERIESLSYRGQDISPAVILERCRSRHHGRGALTGPKGSGKTTLLLEIAETLCAQGTAPLRIRLDESCRRVDWRTLRQELRVPPPPPLLLDGAEQLGLPAWWRLRWLARRVPLLIVTTHRPGRLPTLLRHRTTPGLLAALVGELLDETETANAMPSTRDLEILFEHHGGDIRQCLRELYDRAARFE
jgi:energy-coupling factor transporter ATP-binding protein EcfA2